MLVRRWWEGHLMRKPSSLHSGSQGRTSAHRKEELTLGSREGAWERFTAELTRSKGGDAYCGSSLQGRSFPGPHVFKLGEEKKGQGGRSKVMRSLFHPGAPTLHQGSAQGGGEQFWSSPVQRSLWRAVLVRQLKRHKCTPVTSLFLEGSAK